jgi:hypothetical protein
VRFRKANLRARLPPCTERTSRYGRDQNQGSFGGVTIAHIRPPVGPTAPKSMNMHLTFDEALKLRFGLSQLLAKLNAYNRSTRPCLKTHWVCGGPEMPQMRVGATKRLSRKSR